ncbi:MAG: hypothetical protein IJ080_05765 [Oscillospiraceae bacterium]|nr:hypothetical protein [Oscillospiraceae bacterium]
MEILRKIALAAGTAAFLICALFLNVMGGTGILLNSDEKYHVIGVMLIASAAVFLGALVFSFIRRSWANLLSLFLNICATVLYIMPIERLTSLTENNIPKASVDRLTSRIYPSAAVTVLLAAAVIADYLSYDRAAARMEKKKEKNRRLREDEKIV